MAKRKMSTFERLQHGKLNRNQRRELGRRLNSEDPGLQAVHPDAAGIDIGNESHFVAIPPDRDATPIREFGSWTADLHKMASWLTEHGITTVALQSTGVYWIAVVEVLEQAGLEVYLVNARKEPPGTQDDVQNEWIKAAYLRTVEIRSSTGRDPRQKTSGNAIAGSKWQQGGAAHAEGADDDERNGQ
jgi:hypothetical protein